MKGWKTNNISRHKVINKRRVKAKLITYVWFMVIQLPLTKDFSHTFDRTGHYLQWLIGLDDFIWGFTVQMGWANFTLKLILHFSNQTKSTEPLAVEFVKTSNTVKTFNMNLQQLIVLVNTYLHSSCSVSASPRYRSQCLSCLEQEKAINIRYGQGCSLLMDRSANNRHYLLYGLSDGIY